MLFLIKSLITFDPVLPPIINKISRSSLNPHIFFPFILSPFNISSLIGLPVKIPLLSFIYLRLSLKVTQSLSQNGADNLFARPGVISDSCATIGIFFRWAAITTGTATNPPLENTISGFSFANILVASNTPFRTLNGSVKFLKSKYRLNFPLLIP